MKLRNTSPLTSSLFACHHVMMWCHAVEIHFQVWFIFVFDYFLQVNFGPNMERNVDRITTTAGFEVGSLWRSHQTDKWWRQSGESSANSASQTCTSVRLAFSCSPFTFTVLTVEFFDLRNVRWSAWRTVGPQDSLCFFLFFWGVSTWWRIFKVKSAP